MISRLVAAWTASLLQQRQHFLESAALTAPEQLVAGHLRAGDERARALHAAASHRAVFLGTPSHGVTCHVHAGAALEPAGHRLAAATGRSDPAHTRLAAS